MIACGFRLAGGSVAVDVGDARRCTVPQGGADENMIKSLRLAAMPSSVALSAWLILQQIVKPLALEQL